MNYVETNCGSGFACIHEPSPISRGRLAKLLAWRGGGGSDGMGVMKGACGGVGGRGDGPHAPGEVGVGVGGRRTHARSCLSWRDYDYTRPTTSRSAGGGWTRASQRAASKTDFILPAGHEEREREKEDREGAKGQQEGVLWVVVERRLHTNKGHTRQASRTESVYTIRQHKRTMLQKLMFWKKTGEDGRTRTVHPNFHRFANLYFLFIVLLNFVPRGDAFGKEVAMLPLIFVLGITAIKDAFEDRRRYLSDGRVNYATCRVYSR
ncbi:hypothetical protein Pcinc_016488 [Petrolisthes cinctipes]|uniref:P-type ATPase N-terminal domain-containing protein n=1 Tax=Petrolisthes cinctipes TaxID=88211 RepID=A0AAE1KR02_PETCI|nr:hypothetical protein Pcinc_016488 [Petrolisthes cinctipes]